MTLDYKRQTLEFMSANFGKAGPYYYWISRGIDERPVRANRIRKRARQPAVSRSTSTRRSGSGNSCVYRKP
jgi:nucleotidyltransferase/DNA polymerase involved in DNA repair